MGLATGDSIVICPWDSVSLYQAAICSDWQAVELTLAVWAYSYKETLFCPCATTKIWGLSCASIFRFLLLFWQLLHDIDSLLVIFLGVTY